MFGVPANLDLTFLHGTSLRQVCFALYQVDFHFDPVGQICVEGAWELLDAAGEKIDGSSSTPERPPSHLPKLVGRHVVRTSVAAPKWFALHFETGEVLRIYDDSEQYESFQIQPGDIIV